MIIEELTEDELYLIAILQDHAGIDQAEFLWTDPTSHDGLFRAHDYQVMWFRDESTYSADQCGRAVGKSLSIHLRGFAFPLAFPGNQMLITAPELNHLRPVVDEIEKRLLSCRITREMHPKKPGLGITRNPHWQARATNGTLILSRIPGAEAAGTKGIHSLRIELDEAQDYHPQGFIETVESLNRFQARAQWRIHGVSKGARDKFYEITTSDQTDVRMEVSGEDHGDPLAGVGWKVWRRMAMHRPTWGDAERQEKIKMYGGSEDAPDYRRNIYGEHGDAANPLFVLSRLMEVVASGQRKGLQQWDTEYNRDIYTCIRLASEPLEFLRQENPQASILELMGPLPGHHLTDDYVAFFAGADIGYTIDPTELLVFGVVANPAKHPAHKVPLGHVLLRCLLRIQMKRIGARDQQSVFTAVMDHYGPRLVRLGMDRSGNGLPLYQFIQADRPDLLDKIAGYNFSQKVPVEIDEQKAKLIGKEKLEELALERNVIDYASDELRKLVDGHQIELPWDRELLSSWMGQTVSISKSASNPNGTGRRYNGSGLHLLDASKMMAAGRGLKWIEDLLNAAKPPREDVLLRFL